MRIIRARAREPRTAEHYRRAGIDLEVHVEQMLESFHRRPRAAAPLADAMLNTDLFPRDELRARYAPPNLHQRVQTPGG